jgi:hypothetical protein
MEQREDQQTLEPPANPQAPPEAPTKTKRKGKEYTKPSIVRHGNLRMMTQLE